MLERVELHGRVWAIGLRWAEPIHKMVSLKALLRQAQELDVAFDTAARHKSGRKSQQYGFAAIGETWPEFHSVHALCPFLKLDDSFLGLFCLRSIDGRLFWWLCLRLNNVYAEFGDQIFEDAEEAKATVKLMAQASGLSPHISESPMASTEWLEERLEFSHWSGWFFDRGHLVNLTKLASRATIRRISIIAITLCLVFGISGFWSFFSEKAALDAARQTQEARKQRKAEIESHPENFFKMEWQTKPHPAAFASACLESMLALPLSSNGWELKSAVCNGKTLSLEWSHARGARFTRLPENAKLDKGNPRIARSSLPVQTLPNMKRSDGPGTDHHQLVDRDSMVKLLSEITQISVARLAPVKFKPQQKRTIEKVTIAAPWHEASLELSAIPDVLVSNSKSSLFTLLSEIPGLSIESISFEKEWKLRGSVYARH